MTRIIETFQRAMKFIPIIAFLFVSLSGCASRPTSSIAPKDSKRAQQEIQVLQTEIDQAVRGLAKVQEQLAKLQRTSPEDLKRELDRQIMILRQARDRLTAEEKKLRQRYQLWDLW